jgi:uncharacterized protein YjdB
MKTKLLGLLLCVLTACTLEKQPQKIPVTSISLNITTLQLETMETKALIATVSPDNATDKTISWTSSNENIATVNNMGLVTATGTGLVNIKAKSGDQEASCTIFVVSNPQIF